MLPVYARSAITLMLLTGVATAPLAGCTSIEKETGIGTSAQTGALGGGAFGGIVAALAGANPAWIAASIILGGVAGGVIGDHLGKEDATKHADNNLRALDTLGKGQTSRWSNAQTGNSGSTTVNSIMRKPDGTVCKGYTETVHTGEKRVTEQGTACKAPGGTWAVQTS